MRRGSGTGKVAEGVVFMDGTAVMRWLTEHRSTTVYESAREVVAIHGHGGKTRHKAHGHGAGHDHPHDHSHGAKP